jgi:hypothetical protein
MIDSEYYRECGIPERFSYPGLRDPDWKPLQSKHYGEPGGVSPVFSEDDPTLKHRLVCSIGFPLALQSTKFFFVYLLVYFLFLSLASLFFLLVLSLPKDLTNPIIGLLAAQ